MSIGQFHKTFFSVIYASIAILPKVLTFWALALQNILDTLSDVLDKCLHFSLIKIESVSITQAKPRLVPSL